ncbi:unnamed protein product [Phytophthora fragariaefolia]|uniref:Unnamed protein product n=1 Tax=Phytophthora fragariaefolia TaxID=1490495 RepID=A0A9W6XD27_9STRA|nr:unnamed protein product [Phytophthora fragariaefolia]
MRQCTLVNLKLSSRCVTVGSFCQFVWTSPRSYLGKQQDSSQPGTRAKTSSLSGAAPALRATSSTSEQRDALRSYRALQRWKKSQQAEFDALVKLASSFEGDEAANLKKAFKPQLGGLRLDPSSILIEAEFTKKTEEDSKDWAKTVKPNGSGYRSNEQNSSRRDSRTASASSRNGTGAVIATGNEVEAEAEANMIETTVDHVMGFGVIETNTITTMKRLIAIGKADAMTRTVLAANIRATTEMIEAMTGKAAATTKTTGDTVAVVTIKPTGVTTKMAAATRKMTVFTKETTVATIKEAVATKEMIAATAKGTVAMTKTIGTTGAIAEKAGVTTEMTEATTDTIAETSTTAGILRILIVGMVSMIAIVDIAIATGTAAVTAVAEVGLEARGSPREAARSANATTAAVTALTVGAGALAEVTAETEVSTIEARTPLRRRIRETCGRQTRKISTELRRLASVI